VRCAADIGRREKAAAPAAPAMDTTPMPARYIIAVGMAALRTAARVRTISVGGLAA